MFITVVMPVESNQHSDTQQTIPPAVMEEREIPTHESKYRYYKRLIRNS